MEILCDECGNYYPVLKGACPCCSPPSSQPKPPSTPKHPPAPSQKLVVTEEKGGLLTWLFGKKTFLTLHGNGRYDQEVVGESNYQSALKKIAGGYTKEKHKDKVKAVLICEDDNEHDDKAVQVTISCKTVGYLCREDARTYRKKLKKIGYGRSYVVCDAIICGGQKLGLFNKTFFGVWLDISLDEPFPVTGEA